MANPVLIGAIVEWQGRDQEQYQVNMARLTFENLPLVDMHLRELDAILTFTMEEGDCAKYRESRSLLLA